MRADVPCTTKEIAEVCTQAKGEQPVVYFIIYHFIGVWTYVFKGKHQRLTSLRMYRILQSNSNAMSWCFLSQKGPLTL